ncbi:increased DNA methylation 1-like [Tripterygium wilfordii]|uniref:increased DNA methylation 1-like n=1 Tax=Tripterygium wilfordii TaxID=458696 RepID=UPI0018F7E5A4|nr:increased DNA methylation 1-like [Tripterygium wilfordii]
MIMTTFAITATMEGTCCVVMDVQGLFTHIVFFCQCQTSLVAPAGRVAGVDPIEQITKRCIRIVKSPEAQFGGCVLCRSHDFSKIKFGPRTVILCDQCEKEFHVGCLKDHNMDDLKELPEGNWFCCSNCNRIHSALQKLVVHGEERLPEPSLNALKKKHEENGSESVADLEISWRVLSGKMSASTETRVLLNEAIDIFHERFDPIIDPSIKSGNSTRDLIPAMTYGRNFKGQELGGMYCAVLMVNHVVVSAGIFRILGQELAELPLVATRSSSQGQGYFGLLFSCIEKLVGFLTVKNLVLPAAEEAESIWLNKFGFSKLSPEELFEYRKTYQMMIFQGTSMLRKPVPRCRIIDKSKNA